MAVTLIVNNIPFDYPEQGEQQPWGEAATGWASEVTTVLNSINNAADILESSFTLANNVSSYSAIPGFFFDPAVVRSFIATGCIFRSYNPGTGVIELREEFQITGLNTGSGWVIQQEGSYSKLNVSDSTVVYNIDSGISFNLDTTGQMQYKSSNLVTHISGLIKFKATTVLI